MKKNRIIVLAVLFLVFQGLGNAQNEKKIQFNKGILKICSSKKFEIKGYDGDEVVIKSLHKKRSTYYATTVSNFPNVISKSTQKESTGVTSGRNNGQTYYYIDNTTRSKGLKKLGKKNENKELGIYFVIEEKDGELIFRDNDQRGSVVMVSSDERYEIKIPNSIKLQWITGSCSNDEKYNGKLVRGKATQTVLFYNSTPSSLNDFSGEVEISSTLSNLKLKDVIGPVSINTVGGNVTIEFENKKPQMLYSIYSNNGFIDMQIPKGSNVQVDAIGKAVYSDVDFKILEEKEVNDFGHVKNMMKLKLGAGKVRMNLDAGYGNIYLRKQ